MKGNSKNSFKRVRSRSWFFTWNNPDENYLAQLHNSFSDLEFVFQMEKGENGTKHLQGVVRYTNPRDSWPQINNTIHWERCRNWRSAVKYCSKVETRIDGPWTNIDKLKFRATIRDPLMNKNLYIYQQKILSLIKQPPSERQVHWYWESIGCTGKSSLAKHIALNYNCVLLNGCSKDCFYALKTYNETKDIHVVIFDLTRNQENRVSYTCLEAVKNGCFFSGKYESSQCMINIPHVIVFSNFKPDENKMSEDRWDIHYISTKRMVTRSAETRRELRS